MEAPTEQAGQTGPPTPSDSPLTMADVLGSPRHRRLMTPTLRVGDPAIDFRLPVLGGADGPWGDVADLAAERGRRPVALIFGSYT
jgi:hypothetical protein